MNTVEIILIAFSFLLFALFAAALAFAMYFFGLFQGQSKIIVSAARREKRLNRSLFLWQDKALSRNGAGSLKLAEPKANTGDDAKSKAPKFTSPSEAIEREKADRARVVPQVTTKPVPPAIKGEFLKEAETVRASV